MRLRAAVHVHSDWSFDGHWPLQKIARVFTRLGYGVVLMTEHDRGFTQDRWRNYRAACATSSTSRLLLVPGIEFSDANNVVHVLAWGDWPFPGEGLPTSDAVDHVNAHNGVAVLAHPTRKNAWELITPQLLRNFSGIELWNRKTDGWAPSRDAAALLRSAVDVIPYVGMDFHRARQLFPVAMHLDAESRTQQSVLNAIRRQNCTACVAGLPVGLCDRGVGGMIFRQLEHARQIAVRFLRRSRNAVFAS